MKFPRSARAHLRRLAAGSLGLVAVLTAAETRPERLVPDAAALARLARVNLPAPPSWEKNRETTVATIADLEAEFAKATSTPPRVHSLRPVLLRPVHAWLLDYNVWFRSVEKPLRIEFEAEVFDCDNYAATYVAFADLLALRAGEVRGSSCIGWASVHYRKSFAGIKAGGMHAVVIVGTSQGLHVLEPQNGTMVPLREFPNRHTIEEVYF